VRRLYREPATLPAAAPSPDQLDRLFRCLVTNLADLDPSRLHRPFPVAELVESLVPYRTHRAALGLESGEDYEMTVLRLLAGQRGYATVEPDDVREILTAEVTAVNPETGLFRRYRDAMVRLDPDAVNAALGVTEPGEPEAKLPQPLPEPAPVAAEDQEDEELEGQPLPFVLEESEDEDRAVPAAQPRETSHAAPCPYCGGELPVGRAVMFCPHCGQNVGVVHCPTCGSELDVGWRFCITCGQKVTGLG
jgi:hypothetical protein